MSARFYHYTPLASRTSRLLVLFSLGMSTCLLMADEKPEKPKGFKWSWNKKDKGATPPPAEKNSDYKWSWQKEEGGADAAAARLSAENATLSRRLEDLEAQLSKARKDLSVARNVAVVAAGNSSSGSEDGGKLKLAEAEVESLSRQLRERTSERDTLRSEIERLLDRQDKQVAAIRNVQPVVTPTNTVDVTKYETRIADLELKNKTLIAELKALPVASSKELRLAVKERDKAEEVLIEVAKARKELESEVLQLKRTTEAKDIALSAQAKELETLKSELSRRESRLIMAERVNDRIEQTHSEVDEVREREQLARHYNLAVAYMERGRAGEAEDEFLSALAIAPGNPDLHYNLGVLYDDYLANPRKAVLHYKKYLDLNPNGDDVDQVRGWLFSVQAERK